MAAAEYFSSAPMTGQQQQQHYSSPFEMSSSQERPPTSNPTGHIPNNSNTSIPHIQTHPPPPHPAQNYNNGYAGGHNAPAPNYQQYPSNHQSPNLRPYQPQQQNSYPSSQPIAINAQRPQHPYGPTGHTPPMNYITPPYGSASPHQYLTPQMRPQALSQPSQLSLESGYSSDPERQRRRRNRHNRHHDDHESSRDLEKASRPRSRSTKTDAWVGAAGGGLIGDLIFPGLGTLGGAAIGWLGGKEYARERKVREDKLHDAQKDWEKKWRPGQHGHHHSRSRSRDREHNSRGSSQIGERRGSHDSRRSHH